MIMLWASLTCAVLLIGCVFVIREYWLVMSEDNFFKGLFWGILLSIPFWALFFWAIFW